jgi:hypothetical protein
MTPQSKQDFVLWSSALNKLGRDIKLAEAKHWRMEEANSIAKYRNLPEPYTSEELFGASRHYESLKWKLVEAQSACAAGHLYLVWKLSDSG